MNTAGRTVAYSGLIVAGTISTMLVFPQYLLRSLAYAGIASVVFSLLGALIVAPALIVALRARLNALDIRLLIGRRAQPENLARPRDTAWYRIALRAMRYALPIALVSTAVMVAIGAPALGMKLGYPDDRALPTSASPRQAGDFMRGEFTQNFAGTVHIVLPHGIRSPREVTGYAIALSKVADVTTVAGPNGIYSAGKPISAVTVDSALRGDAAYLTVSTVLDPFSDAGKRQLTALRRVPAPADVIVGGLAQRNLDNVRGITRSVPIVLGLIAFATFLLVFLMTGSVALPIKALLMNVLSMIAAFGVMVWIFQDGHLGGAGTLGTGHTTAFIPPLMACVAYALAMDYEVFVLSRIREEWLASDRSAAANEQAVAVGLARSGRIVTAAATVMIIVFVAIAAGSVSFMRGLGVGLAVGIALDAFVVRTLLVPAFMRLMGRANWWAPGPLRRWHEKWGLAEHDSPDSERDLAAVSASADLVHD
jgi:RND superfamily putative drug exporter